MTRQTVLRSVALFAASLLLPFTPAWGLEPGRAITQALLRKWQVPQGLPQATITKIVQTSDGYLWLGTQSGLYRFDGIRFVTAVPKFGSLGYLTMWPAGQAMPLASTLNSLNGQIVANAALTPAGDGGRVSVYVTDDADIVIDVNGYFTP